MMILTGKTIVSALRPPYPYGGEFVSQFLFALRLCWFPLLVSTVAFGYGAPGLQAANFLVLFGALDRLGGPVRRYELSPCRITLPVFGSTRDWAGLPEIATVKLPWKSGWPLTFARALPLRPAATRYLTVWVPGWIAVTFQMNVRVAPGGTLPSAHVFV